MAEQTEKAFLKQPKVFLSSKKSGKGKRPGKGGNRYWKSIGLGFKTPREAIEGAYIDKKCPFTGTVSIRGRILAGTCHSAKMTSLFAISSEESLPSIFRYEKRHSNIPAHISPCFRVKEGDHVIIGQCRPLSKTVRFNVLKVIPAGSSGGGKKAFTGMFLYLLTSPVVLTATGIVFGSIYDCAILYSSIRKGLSSYVNFSSLFLKMLLQASGLTSGVVPIWRKINGCSFFPYVWGKEDLAKNFGCDLVSEEAISFYGNVEIIVLLLLFDLGIEPLRVRSSCNNSDELLSRNQLNWKDKYAFVIVLSSPSLTNDRNLKVTAASVLNINHLEVADQVFDGHGGKDASHFVCDHFPRVIVEDVDFPLELEKADTRSFMETDAAFAKSCSLESSLASLLVVNAGDSRTVLSWRGRAIEMSKDHRPCCVKERRQIESLGGLIDDGYLNGLLGITRALGDWHLERTKETGERIGPLSAEPELKLITLTKEDEFLIIDRDGIWDVFTRPVNEPNAHERSQNAIDFTRRRLQEHNDVKLCCKEIVEEATKRGATDNLTVVVVSFHSEPPRPCARQRGRVRRSISAEGLQSLKCLLEG
ncbi:putative protein phosphatase 2C 27 [Hibiscus syriacus]|uniref:Small ribosomal subunit protein uS17 n=1 Tax=Hibiscus syriacus TaxID=106335 RepID=A0A6A3D462_HIBSY|nr:putative protein phosphatase 2C 27 [Hibiscus syriacus]